MIEKAPSCRRVAFLIALLLTVAQLFASIQLFVVPSTNQQEVNSEDSSDIRRRVQPQEEAISKVQAEQAVKPLVKQQEDVSTSNKETNVFRDKGSFESDRQAQPEGRERAKEQAEQGEKPLLQQQDEVSSNKETNAFRDKGFTERGTRNVDGGPPQVVVVDGDVDNRLEKQQTQKPLDLPKKHNAESGKTPKGKPQQQQQKQKRRDLPEKRNVESRERPDLSKKTAFNETEYNLRLKETLRSFSNVTTVAYQPLQFYSGYRNQGMVFTGFILKTMELNHSQILLQSIKWKDQFGTNRRIQHDVLFDVVHWNSFYPQLPRFVGYDPKLHTHFNGKRNKWRIAAPRANATKPYAIARGQPEMMNTYKRYTKHIMWGIIDRHPADLLMLRGAFRPHPALQQLIDKLLQSLDDDDEPPSAGGGTNRNSSYMALHARIEPDMQRHPVCRDIKVTSLKRIFELLQQKFPDPPVSKMLIVTGRPLLEKEGKDPNSPNQLAVENLKVLNQAIEKGLWGGRVKVFEAGEPALQNSKFAAMPSIAGGILNYFLSLEAQIFVGTEVSTYSTDIQTTRYYRGNLENYKYVPDGIELTTPANATRPPRFGC